jgi:hypothetical protein
MLKLETRDDLEALHQREREGKPSLGIQSLWLG